MLNICAALLGTTRVQLSFAYNINGLSTSKLTTNWVDNGSRHRVDDQLEKLLRLVCLISSDNTGRHRSFCLHYTLADFLSCPTKRVHWTIVCYCDCCRIRLLLLMLLFCCNRYVFRYGLACTNKCITKWLYASKVGASVTDAVWLPVTEKNKLAGI